ncbi:hypothetical protein ACLB2K_029830 [Fragaria x ananassa]
MTDPLWVSSEEIVMVSSSPGSDSDTLHQMEEGLVNLMAEIALDLGEGIPVMDARSHVSSSNPLLQEYTLACLHVAPGQVTPNMLKQILVTGVLFRLLKQEFPNCMEFNVCWHMRRGKLSPRYIGPYEIIERVGSLAYRLALPSELSKIHNVFYVSMLRKYIADPSHVLEEQPISLQKDLFYAEEPVQILDRKEQVNSARQSALEKPPSRGSYLGVREADEAAISLSL